MAEFLADDVVIRRPRQGDEAFLRQLWRDAFPEDREGGFVPWYFARCYRPEHTLLLEWQGRLAAMAFAPEVMLSVGQRTARAVYIQGVATVESLRGRGFCRRLLDELLERLAADGVEYALLKPFDAAFYRPLGFAFCAYVRRYNVDLNKYFLLPPRGDYDLQHYLDVPSAAADAAAVYAAWSRGFGTFPLRDERACRLLLEDHKADGGMLLLARRGGLPLAYALYNATAQGIFVRELAFTDVRAAGELLAVLAHDYREDTPQAVIITPDAPFAAAMLPDELAWQTLPFAMVRVPAAKGLTACPGGCYNLDRPGLPQPVYFYEYF